MKNVMIFTALLLSFSSFASLENSNLELRHQNLIEKAITAKCRLTRGFIAEVSTEITEISIDQGITDYAFVTLLEVHENLEHNMYDVYEVTVKSSYADAYDHITKEWGIYSVESVSSCVMK